MRARAPAWCVAFVLCGSFFTSSAWGQNAPPATAEAESAPRLFGIDVHGFVSPGFVLSTGNAYLPNSTRGTPEFAEVGINFTRVLTEQLRAGMQLFARDFGRVGNYSAKFDWFYVDYRVFDWFGLRAGRVKIPFGLYNEIQDVDPARVSVLLPQSVYPLQNRDFLLAQTGGEAYGYAPLGVMGGLEYRLYAGTTFLEVSDAPGLPYEIKNLDTRYVVGGRLLWETPLEGLRVGGSVQALRLDGSLVFDAAVFAPLQMAGELPPDFSGEVHVELPAVLWVASLEYAWHGFMFAAEYSRWLIELESSTPQLYPNAETTSEKLYGLASFTVTSWFTPGVYYAYDVQDVNAREGRAASQHDTALTLRFDINEYWLVKLEGHYLHGTAWASSELNGGRPQSSLDPDWFMFLLKTTLYF